MRITANYQLPSMVARYLDDCILPFMLSKFFSPLDRIETRSLAFVAVVAASLSCSCSRTNEAAAREENPLGPSVAAVRVEAQDVSRNLTLSGEFRPFQEVDVMAKVAGYIKAIHVDIGDRVTLGQLLAELEIPEMADDQMRAQSIVSKSQAEVARSKDELRRAESSHEIAHLSYTRLAEVGKQKTGLVAQQEIDDAHSKDLTAEAQVSAAQANLTAMEQQVQVSAAELQKVHTLLEYTRVIAPFDGIVTRRYADIGSMIQAGTSSSTQVMPVVRLSQNSLLRLILPVPESAVPEVHVGQDVSVVVSSLNRSFRGKVARLGGKVASTTRTMDTEVDVPNPGNVLVPGMYAEVTLTLRQARGAITVPITAVDTAGNGGPGKVFVVTADNHIEIRNVQLGMQTPTSYEARSGLRAGEIVVMSARSGLHSGDSVRPHLAENATQPTP